MAVVDGQGWASPPPALEALIGRTEVDKVTCLKLTLLNPNAREADLAALLALVREAGSAAFARGLDPWRPPR